ncbi:MAG: hypothetical protein GY720_19780 [bacterium]|nr:hypothetical protein [bacterium]
MSRGLLSTLLAFVLVLGACGGDSGDGEPRLTTTSTAQEPLETDSDATTTTTAAPAPEEPAATADEGTGTATIGDTTWEFALAGDLPGTCNPDLGGSFFVVLNGQDANGEGVLLSITVPNSADDPVVQIGSAVIGGQLWIADSSVHQKFPNQNLPQEIGATATVNGNSVSGSGVFYEERSLTETRQTGGTYETGVLEGTFSATCPAG